MTVETLEAKLNALHTLVEHDRNDVRRVAEHVQSLSVQVANLQGSIDAIRRFTIAVVVSAGVGGAAYGTLDLFSPPSSAHEVAK